MKHSIALAFLVAIVAGAGLPASAQQGQKLPWEREIPLREAARSVFLTNTLNPTDPLPDRNSFPVGKAMAINNLKMRTTLWGPPHRVTISLTKNNVWDRRVNPRGLEAPTLQQIFAGAYSPANKGYAGKHPISQRPWGYGYLLPESGFYDPYRQPIEYPMPCLKPVGQIILGMDPLAGATAPVVTQSAANGLVKLEMSKGKAKARLEYVLGMTSNLYAIRGEFSGMDTPVWLRLYRHRDTAHLQYMTEDGKYTRVGTEGDKAFNYPMDPPTSGKDGRHFWIRQRMPPEKTFPQGFEYVLMGLVLSPGKVSLDAVEGQRGLGTPPDEARKSDDSDFMREIAARFMLDTPENAARIAKSPGAAATATFKPGADGKVEALVTIVTTMDGSDLLAVAKNRLAAAEAAGFDGVVLENTQWWNAFYDKRENGRMYRGLSGTDCTDDIREIYQSYADGHGGGTDTDMRQYECSAGYVAPDRDYQLWSSAPCYNEIFSTDRFVRNRADNQDMWKQLVWHWMPGAKDNARNMFGMPGMAFLHGYQPPIKPDKFVHTAITLEFCFDTMAQTIKPAWDEWDYGGDIEVLRKEAYPLMREMALFYAAYAKKGDDGYYHVIPSMEPERWGWYADFARNKDAISSLSMFRWALNRTAEASEILGVDSDLRANWREVADKLAPYPTWDTPVGPVFAAIPGVEPKQSPGDHFMEAAHYPTVLADEINLDSPKELKEKMLRTVRLLPQGGSARHALTLLGVVDDQERGQRPAKGYDAEALLNSRSGRIHLFPAVPADAELAFRNFQARGGFLVSAARDAKGVYFLEVEARRNMTCQIMNPWPGRPAVIRESGKASPVPVRIDRSNGECLVFPAVAGRTYSIQAR